MILCTVSACQQLFSFRKIKNRLHASHPFCLFNQDKGIDCHPAGFCLWYQHGFVCHLLSLDGWNTIYHHVPFDFAPTVGHIYGSEWHTLAAGNVFKSLCSCENAAIRIYVTLWIISPLLWSSVASLVWTNLLSGKSLRATGCIPKINHLWTMTSKILDASHDAPIISWYLELTLSAMLFHHHWCQ